MTIARKFGWGIPLLLTAATFGTLLVGDVLARRSPVIANHVAQELERQREVNGVYLYDQGYTDDADFLFLGQIPHDDYSRGGVYFFGDSQTNVSISPWRFSEEERSLIHNYAIGALRHSDVESIVHMLVEDFDLLQAGAERTTVFLGVSYYMARPQLPGVTLRYYVQRHHLYSYDKAGMHPRNVSPLRRTIANERDYIQRFLSIVLDQRQSRVTVFLPGQQTPEGRRLDDSWPQIQQGELAHLARTIDYLHARGVHVEAFHPPSGSWDNEAPYEAAYRAQLLPLLQARGVPFTDYGDLLRDDQFADGTHPNFESLSVGQELQHAAARDALRRMGLM